MPEILQVSQIVRDLALLGRFSRHYDDCHSDGYYLYEQLLHPHSILCRSQFYVKSSSARDFQHIQVGCQSQKMVYNYTKPRGPIAAQYSSPGPCYAMPPLVGQKSHDTRSTHERGPAYSFGVRHGKWNDDGTPGPQYYPDPKYLRTGRDASPAYTLHSRTKDFSLDDRVPGPGQYDPRTADPHVWSSSPRYSLHYRHKEFRTDQTPGPNHYVVPSTLGKTVDSRFRSMPASSLSGRSKFGGFAEDWQHTPGPGAYKVVNPDLYKPGLPKYSITGRNPMPGDTTVKPGPGAYQPESHYKSAKPREPAFSFGIRHSQYAGTLITSADIQG